ncbi:hypothetical protein HMPREF1981_03417 [Bacteroides pyogenes F0041]|uniref:Uncharacterized protein n=1 Tax=Bacteroides pyogenes F0041 TaxID=1321819 RepID=U2BS95_9BACE|nr:hypothetical protein HMPREF1981_03417 [Bacteroides pyogenes F0041]
MFGEETSSDGIKRSITKTKQKPFSIKYIGSIRRRNKLRRN